MSDLCRAFIVQRIRESGPLTFAEFMDLALYHPAAGYYATAPRRSGGTGDFYTSVDVGPLFGEFLAEQFAEMARIVLGPSKLPYESPSPFAPASPFDGRRGGACSAPEGACSAPEGTCAAPPFDLVEAAAGNGRLSRDVLNALESIAPDVYSRTRLHLVERSAAARAAQSGSLGRHGAMLASSSPELPPAADGVVFANELLDALPTHSVVCRPDGLKEVFIDAVGGQLVEREMAPSTPALSHYFATLGAQLLPGWRAEVNLAALEWVRGAARTLRRGFLVLIDYGHEAQQLYSAAHAQGTLATFTGHVVGAREEDGRPPWLGDPGSSDITAHVDFTSIRRVAETEGFVSLCVVDQMHFLLALGVERRLQESTGQTREEMTRRLALKTLLVPGGLGTTHHVMIFGRNIGHPALKGCAGFPY